jgi:HEAT repeat protein
LFSGNHDQKLQAAAELNRLGVRTRGSIRPRGTLSRAAANRLPDAGQIDQILTKLETEAAPDIQAGLANALGEWGGERTAEALIRILQRDTDEDVRISCISALRKIGGVAAAEALRDAIERGPEAVREAALRAIEELASGGPVEDHEPAALEQTSNARLTGAVRTRGGRGAIEAEGPRREDLVERLSGTLKGVQADPRTSSYLRLKASQVLGLLRH